ncbi:MAG: hypothetical protein H7267_14645, partial [Sandarakinorhabdus sp.]|nr:hypothetical protein [Sandarakinorhabdus sp.]
SPLAVVGAADVRALGNGNVDIVLRPTQRFPLGWLQMWPHVQPWKVGEPQPMLRAIPASFAPMLASALISADPQRTTIAVTTPAETPAVTPVATPMGVAA